LQWITRFPFGICWIDYGSTNVTGFHFVYSTILPCSTHVNCFHIRFLWCSSIKLNSTEPCTGHLKWTILPYNYRTWIQSNNFFTPINPSNLPQVLSYSTQFSAQIIIWSIQSKIKMLYILVSPKCLPVQFVCWSFLLCAVTTLSLSCQ